MDRDIQHLRQTERVETDAKLNIKGCPKCNGWLRRRRNGHDGTYFLGCTNYPTCQHTEKLPEDLYMRASGAATLPGFS